MQGIRMASMNRAMKYDEELVVPIIENTPFEHDLSDSMAQVKQERGGWGKWKMESERTVCVCVSERERDRVI